jgi:hypothetical protein
LANLFKNVIKFKAVVESNPVVGSSKKMMEGLIKSYKPIEVLFFYPPEMPLILLSPTYVSLHLLSPRKFMTLLTISTFYSSVFLLSLISAMNLKASKGVKVGSI